MMASETPSGRLPRLPWLEGGPERKARQCRAACPVSPRSAWPPWSASTGMAAAWTGTGKRLATNAPTRPVSGREQHEPCPSLCSRWRADLWPWPIRSARCLRRQHWRNGEGQGAWQPVRQRSAMTAAVRAGRFPGEDGACAGRKPLPAASRRRDTGARSRGSNARVESLTCPRMRYHCCRLAGGDHLGLKLCQPRAAAGDLPVQRPAAENNRWR